MHGYTHSEKRMDCPGVTATLLTFLHTENLFLPAAYADWGSYAQETGNMRLFGIEPLHVLVVLIRGQTLLYWRMDVLHLHFSTFSLLHIVLKE